MGFPYGRRCHQSFQKRIAITKKAELIGQRRIKSALNALRDPCNVEGFPFTTRRAGRYTRRRMRKAWGFDCCTLHAASRG